MKRLPILLLPLLIACPTTPEPPDPGPCAIAGLPGLVDGTTVNPFPSAHLATTAETATGCRLAIPDGALPVGVGSDPMDVRRFDRRDGFSPGQTSWWRPNVAIDPATLPPWNDASASLAADAGVQLWNLDTGERLLGFAEVDAFPDQGEQQRVVLVRPLKALPLGARVAVAVTNAVTDQSGAPLTASGAFRAIRDGQEAGVEPAVAAHYERLIARLEELGVPRGDLVLAWDFPVGTAPTITRELDHVLAAMRQEVPLDATFVPDVTVNALLVADDGGPIPASGLWRELRAEVPLTHYLWDEDDDASDEEHDAGVFRLDADGLPIARGLDETFLIGAVPESVRTAAAGSVPVVVFGHGIFSAPQDYISHASDQNSSVELLNRLGAIGIGTEWRGLTERDRPDAVRVAVNLGRFPLITDKMIQGVSNTAAVARLTQTAFIDHAAFEAEGGGSLIDPDRVFYFGISLGGIEGATLLSLSEVLDTGVVHVPGSIWSTMLERSTHWNTFETFVFEAVDAPWDRQLLYAASQLYWDPVDPIVHAPNLAGRNVLMQISVGDEQVPNFTAEALARSVGLPQLPPGVEPVQQLGELEVPTAPGSSGFVQFDSQLGRPPLTNRPATSNYGAHTAIRHTDEVMAQVEAYFAPGAEGTIVDVCDGAPCVLDVDR